MGLLYLYLLYVTQTCAQGPLKRLGELGSHLKGQSYGREGIVMEQETIAVRKTDKEFCYCN